MIHLVGEVLLRVTTITPLMQVQVQNQLFRRRTNAKAVGFMTEFGAYMLFGLLSASPIQDRRAVLGFHFELFGLHWGPIGRRLEPFVVVGTAGA